MKPFRTAILGCGGWGNRHAQNLVKLPKQIELVALCDVNPSRASNCAKTFAPKASIFTDHHEMLTRVPLDLLIIALPPFAHTDEVQLCAERGIHLLIEKPIALSHQHAWQMVDVAEKVGICTQVGFMYRFGAAIQRLKSLLDTGAAGGVGSIRAGYYCNHLHNPWWIDKTKSGGQVFEQAIHLVDLMRFLGGEVDSVFCVQRNLFHREVPGYSVEDVSGTVINFKNGAVGVLAATNAAIPWKWTWDFKVVAKMSWLIMRIRTTPHSPLPIIPTPNQTQLSSRKKSMLTRMTTCSSYRICCMPSKRVIQPAHHCVKVPVPSTWCWQPMNQLELGRLYWSFSLLRRRSSRSVISFYNY
jgi:predicted dehydrogenase